MKTLALPVCLLTAMMFFYAVFLPPLPDWRIAVVGLFGVGVLLSTVGGWLLGKFLWSAVRRGGLSMVALVIVAVLMVVFMFSALSVLAGYPPVWHEMGEPIICSLAIALLVGSSYVVGFAFLPGPGGAPRRNRILAILLLYGAIGIGVFLHSAYPLPWGKIPPYPETHPTRLTFQEFLSDLREKFPYEHRIEETPEGAIRIHYDGPEFREWPTEIHDDEFVAEGSRAVLPEGTVELLGLDMYCREPDFMHPDGRSRHIVPSEEEREQRRNWEDGDDGRLPWSERVGYWRPDGTPVPKEEWPGEWRSWENRTLVHGAFLFQITGVLRRYDIAGDGEVVLMPWETPVTSGRVGRDPFEDRWNHMENLQFDAPIPGPLELRLPFLRSDEREYVFEGKEGDVIHLERNSFQLLRVLGGRFEKQRRQGGWDPTLVPRGEPEELPGTTVVFMAAFQTYEAETFRLDIRAVTRDGSVMKVPKLDYATPHLVLVEFDCRPEEIERFVFVERARVTQIRFPVTDIPFFPGGNYGMDNLLDMRYPYRVRGSGDIRRSLPEGRTVSGMPGFTVYAPMRNPLNATLRQILNHHYAGGWWVQDGKLRFRKRRTLRSRLLEAIHPEPPRPRPGLNLIAPIQY